MPRDNRGHGWCLSHRCVFAKSCQYPGGDVLARSERSASNSRSSSRRPMTASERSALSVICSSRQFCRSAFPRARMPEMEHRPRAARVPAAKAEPPQADREIDVLLPPADVARVEPVHPLEVSTRESTEPVGAASRGSNSGTPMRPTFRRSLGREHAIRRQMPLARNSQRASAAVDRNPLASTRPVRIGRERRSCRPATNQPACAASAQRPHEVQPRHAVAVQEHERPQSGARAPRLRARARGSPGPDARRAPYVRRTSLPTLDDEAVSGPEPSSATTIVEVRSPTARRERPQHRVEGLGAIRRC